MPQEKREATSYGSGFILKDNYILTNYHVVEDATEVIVSLSDRREFIAEIAGVDPLSDLALLTVEGKNLPEVTPGDSDKLKVGDWVVSIGSPFSFDFSVTWPPAAAGPHAEASAAAAAAWRPAPCPAGRAKHQGGGAGGSRHRPAQWPARDHGG